MDNDKEIYYTIYVIRNNVEIGDVYLRKSKHGKAMVRQVVSIQDGKVYYEKLHGTSQEMRQKRGCCSLKSFIEWSHKKIQKTNDYTIYDGATIHENYLVQNMAGEVILQCSPGKAEFYLKNNCCELVGNKTIRFTIPDFEVKLKELYGTKLNPFFMAKKNDKCTVCGKTYNLTRHHVVPKRHLKSVPIEIKKNISNILYVCNECHIEYEHWFEKNGEPTFDLKIPNNWKDHFFNVMNPKFIPEGWDINVLQQNS